MREVTAPMCFIRCDALVRMILRRVCDESHVLCGDICTIRSTFRLEMVTRFMSQHMIVVEYRQYLLVIPPQEAGRYYRAVRVHSEHAARMMLEFGQVPDPLHWPPYTEHLDVVTQ